LGCIGSEKYCDETQPVERAGRIMVSRCETAAWAMA
jgi:hypothetical protein